MAYCFETPTTLYLGANNKHLNWLTGENGQKSSQRHCINVATSPNYFTLFSDNRAVCNLSHTKGVPKSYSGLGNEAVPYPYPTKHSCNRGFPLLPGSISITNNTMKNPQKNVLFVINMIFNKWNNAPFYSKPFLLDLKNSFFKCSYPMSLYQYNLFI